jgi:predicted dehydrogenase
MSALRQMNPFASAGTLYDDALERRFERVPRIGCLGVGWIGRHRMQAISTAGAGKIVGIADVAEDAALSARSCVPDAALVPSLDALLDLEPDGVLIATPSALHAEQALNALARGAAVFCQKPLARSAAETRRVIDAARAADRLLSVDFSYRHTRGMTVLHHLIAAGEIGRVYAVDLVFHNAYGPDKVWFRDPALSGGGCVIDLGIHLVDLVLWVLGFPRVARVTSRLYAQGEPLEEPSVQVEDYAVAQLDLDGGAVARLACSWNLSAGRDAVIEATFHGTRGSASLRNVNGSFYDFIAERHAGTQRVTLAEPPDAWGGRAAVAWARRLARDRRFDPEIEHAVQVAAVLDSIYGR